MTKSSDTTAVVNLGVDGRNYSFDVLRIVACIMVILCHTAGSCILADYAAPGTFDFSACIALTAITRWDIGAFAMLSGLFLMDPSKNLPTKTVFSKYVARIVGALIVWSLFYGLTLHRPLLPLGTQEGHFWYLPVILGIYITLPVTRWVAGNAKVMQYFIIAWLCYMGYHFLANFIELPIPEYNMLFVDFTGYSMLAYYLKTVIGNNEQPEKAKRMSRIIYLLGAAGLMLTVTAAVVSQDDDSLWMTFTAPHTIAVAAALFVFCLRHPFTPGEKMKAVLKSCSQCSFGIYLVHIWILIQIFKRLHRFIPNNLLLIAVCIVVCFLVGWAMSWLLRKIPFCRKYVL